MKLPPHTIIFRSRANRVFTGHVLEIREAGPRRERVEILTLVNGDTIAIVEPHEIELVQLAPEDADAKPLFERILQTQTA